MTALLGLATAAPPACGDLSVFHDIIAVSLAEKGRSIFQHEREFGRHCENDEFIMVGSQEDEDQEEEQELRKAAKAARVALKHIKADPVQTVATMRFSDIPTMDWAQARDLEEKETKVAMDYMMLWKYRFCKAEHVKDRADLFDAFYCDVDRKMWFYNLLELSRRVAEANAPKTTIPDHVASVSDRLVAAMPPQARTVETMTPAKYRLQAAADVLEGLGLIEDVHKPFTTGDIEAQAELLDDFNRGAAMLGAVDGAPRGKTVGGHRLWAVTELMKQTFGLIRNKVGARKVQVDGVRKAITTYTLKWPATRGLPTIPADAWEAVI